MRVNHRKPPESFGAQTAREGKARDKTAGTEGIARAAAAKKKRDASAGRGTGFKKKLGKVGKALSEGGLNAPPDTSGEEHAQAVAIGRDIQQRAQASQPGKAQAIIKNRRI